MFIMHTSKTEYINNSLTGRVFEKKNHFIANCISVHLNCYYENTPMQYIEFSEAVKFDFFFLVLKKMILFLFLLKT